MLSADLKPSLHLVYPTKVQLLKKMQAKPGDSPVIVELKSKLTNVLHSRYSIKPLHVLAALLDPRMKTGVLSAQERLDAVAALRCMMSEVSDVADAGSSLSAAEPPTMRMRREQSAEADFFSDLTGRRWVILMK